MRNAKCGSLPVTTEPKTFEAFVLLSLNFAHFREDSSRATEALPRRFRRHAHTPTRRYDRRLWLRLCCAVNFCLKSVSHLRRLVRHSLSDAGSFSEGGSLVRGQ